MRDSPACRGVSLDRREIRNSRTSARYPRHRQYGSARAVWDALSVHVSRETSSSGREEVGWFQRRDLDVRPVRVFALCRGVCPCVLS